MPQPMATSTKPSWLTEEKPNSRLVSIWRQAATAPKTIEAAPTTRKTPCSSGPIKSGQKRKAA
ncbi:hypothetical protein D3C72_2105780 [compost metagenome]